MLVTEQKNVLSISCLDFYPNKNCSFLMQHQNSKACKYADLQYFDSVYIQSMYKLCFFEQVVEEKQGKKYASSIYKTTFI